MSTETTYQWLEPKPHKKHTRQLGIKGRNVIVWNLVGEILINERTPEEVAAGSDLPIEAVDEALDYYYANREWIDAEVEAGARRLGLR